MKGGAVKNEEWVFSCNSGSPDQIIWDPIGCELQ